MSRPGLFWRSFARTARVMSHPDLFSSNSYPHCEQRSCPPDKWCDGRRQASCARLPPAITPLVGRGAEGAEANEPSVEKVREDSYLVKRRLSNQSLTHA